jgi:TP901 family phage tail tape measure protein
MSTTLAKLDVILGLNSAKLMRDLNRTRYKIRRVGRQLEGLGRTLSTGITAPLVAVGVASTKMATDFESSMSRIVGLVGESQAQVNQWSAELLKLGLALGKSPKELADAMYFVTSAGIKGAEAMRVLAAAAKASAAGLGDTATVADAVTSAINAYGASSLDAGRATGILVAAVREGKASAESFAPVLGALLPAAADAGIGFDEVAASLAAMTRVGAPAAEAATALRAILVTIKKPSKDAVKALDGIGLSVGALQSMLDERGLWATLQHLKTAFDENGVAMTDVFGNVRALTGVLSLTGGEASKTAGIFSRLAQTTEKDLTAAFDTASGTSAFKLASVLSSITVSAIQLGNVLLPIVIPAAERLGAAIRSATSAFGGMSPQLQKVVVVIAGIAAAIGPVIVAVGAFALAVGTIGTTALAWVGGVAVGLGALALGWDEVQTAALVFWKAVKPVLIEFGDFVGTQFQKVFDFAKRVWPDIQNLVQKVVEKISGFWDRHGGAIMAAVRVTWDFIKNKIGTTLDVVLGSLEVVISLLNGDFTGAWQALQRTVETVSNTMQRVQAAAVASIISGFFLLKAEVGTVMVSVLSDIETVGRAYLALPFVDPLTKAAVTKGLAAVEFGMGRIGASVEESRVQFDGWSERAQAAMQAPFETGVKGAEAFQASASDIVPAFEKSGESIIKVFDSAGNAITGSLTGGFGRAADSVRGQVQTLQNHLNANPLAVRISLDNDAFRRELADLGLQPDTAGALP